MRDGRAPDLFACLYAPPPPAADPRASSSAAEALCDIAREFSPRYELCRAVNDGDRSSEAADGMVVIDVAGLERLLGTPQTIGEELRRTASARGVRMHVSVAGTRTAALMLARSRPGLTVVQPRLESPVLASIAIGILPLLEPWCMPFTERPSASARHRTGRSTMSVGTFERWGLKTLGDLAALPAADLVSRMGRAALVWQAMARGEDVRPLVPTIEDERFESTLELEWPIEGLEPLSFVLTRLLEPLSTRLERRDRGAAVLHVLLGLVTRDVWTRRLELPTPMRDVRSLRALALLDLESHPPAAAIDRVTIVIDPTPGRVVQHRLFARPHPTPEQLSTLLARLGAVMGQDRIGAPAVVDTHRPGAFAMTPFRTEHTGLPRDARDGSVDDRSATASAERGNVPAALRRCRQPVPARVSVADGQPVRVTTDRRGFAGGTVVRCAGPWRSSGNWWTTHPSTDPHPSHLSHLSHPSHPPSQPHPTHQPHLTDLPHPTHQPPPASWDCDEWDVALSDGAVYRVFRDRRRDAWFIDAIAD
ncbi:MAG TPA: hypothetical protein VH583_16675 [Vicinamibacterales bacterium]